MQKDTEEEQSCRLRGYIKQVNEHTGVSQVGNKGSRGTKNTSCNNVKDYPKVKKINPRILSILKDEGKKKPQSSRSNSSGVE